jgi:hypothetical protein
MPVEVAGIPLAHLTSIVTSERARLARHPVPGMSGDLVQTLGRPSVEVQLRGIFYGPSAPDDLRRFREAYLAVTPVDFVVQAVDDSDPTQTLAFSQVLIRELEVVQRADQPDEFDFTCRLLEYVEPPAPAPADLFGALDEDLLGEAAGFVDDAQNALAQVSQLADLLANVRGFGDPTQRLPSLLDSFTSVASGGAGALTGVRDLFGPEG